MHKADYVRAEAANGHDGTHRCHAEGCNRMIAPVYLMCPRHWRMVPAAEQRAVWTHYRKGQEVDKKPTNEYLAALRAAVEAVAVAEGRRAQGSLF